jgi:glycosyltransferase involved in cell wall biosynthesis
MLNILLVPSSDYIGHPFPQRHNQIFERLDERKFQVHVARFKLFPSSRLKTKAIVHELPGKMFGSVASYYLLNIINHASHIKQIIRRESIDVIVLSNISAPFGYTILNSFSNDKIPIIVDLPDYYPTSASGYLFDVQSSFGKIIETTLDTLLSYVMKRASLVTVASKALEEYARRTGAKAVNYVPNGIGECFFNVFDGNTLRKDLGYDSEDLVVGYIGSLEFWLDMKTFIEGVWLARKKGLPVKLLMVGSNLYTDYIIKVKNWIKTKKLDEHTKFLDFVPYEEVPKYMSQLDVGTIPFDLANPTAYYSAPNKMWEYLSQKRPVLSSPIPEAKFNEDCLFTTKTADDYVRCLRSIANGNVEVESKVEIGYNRALKRTWRNSAEIFSTVIQKSIE